MREQEKRKKKRRAHPLRWAAAAAAGLLVCMTVGLNTSEAFAQEMQKVPVIGALARVLTIRSYHGVRGDYEINMEVPEIEEVTPEGESAANTAFTGDINAEIQKIVDRYMEEAEAEFEAYKEAFFATGGTQEEWGDRTMDIRVDYEVKYQEGNVLSLVLTASKAWVASQEERHYYNLDLAEGRYLTLEDMLGEDYIRKANESIVSQIEERLAADDSLSYFGFGTMAEDSIEGFETITADTPFYLNADGNVVIVFEKYEIAPGYMGFQEFEIPAE